MGQKGSSYERDVCKRFSLWWTSGKDDDVFWRTSQSGGRATTRRKRGKKTRAHCGDVCAVDSVGRKFTDLVSLELKKGYPKATTGDIVDKPKKLKQNLMEGFIEQAMTARDSAEVPYWMIVHRRDRREEMVYMDLDLYNALDGTAFDRARIIAFFNARIRLEDGGKQKVKFVAMTLRLFFVLYNIGDFRELWKRHRSR